jgi:dipeptidyl aminopeptidase/acylaminoacyl peptidase
MAKKRLTVEDLWKIERLGKPSLSPDGAQAVCSVARYSMQENKSTSSLYLLSSFGGQPRLLTSCGDKDGEPSWSPRGDKIAFVARREQEGHKDELPQLYIIAPDGGEAVRVTSLATGVSGIKWFSDGKRVAFISWVWPHLKGQSAQAKTFKEFRDRKETAVITEAHQFRYWDHTLPVGREPHVHVVDIETGKITNLFEGSGYALSLSDPDATMFDISPDGKQLVFSFDPEPLKRIINPFALALLDIKTRKIKLLARDKDWNFSSPCFDNTAKRIALIARHIGKRHTASSELAIMDASNGKWQLVSHHWDRELASPPRWTTPADAILFTGEDEGRCHLWECDLASKKIRSIATGGWIHSFDTAADTVIFAADSMMHPSQISVMQAGRTPQRIEQFNDKLLAQFALGEAKSVNYAGANKEQTQMWVTYPPGFDPKKKYPLLHSIHGGPHTASGDTWHYRWNNQVFASGNGTQDYVVVCVNYHGSTSFGFKFKDSITHQWGALELQDIEAATTLMSKKPYIDKERVFASGGSYGGYMVAWMNGHVKKNRYQAYVCHAGCYDWVSMFASDAAEWFKRELGAWYWEDMTKVHAQSPHAYAKHFSTPTLVIHGQLDYRVPDAQGLAYYSTLKAQDIDARLVWYPDENHWILKPRNAKVWYEEFFGWLKLYDPARVKKSAPKKVGAVKASKLRI